MLKKIISYTFIVFLFFSSVVFCMEFEPNTHSAFIAKQGNKIIKTIGNYEEDQPPYSTFKALLAVQAFDSGFFETSDSPIFPFKEVYEEKMQDWYTREIGLSFNWIQSQTPKTFMKGSVIWVSHLITQYLGENKFKGYISQLQYGNQDVVGGPLGSLFDSWLGTSLAISPRQQVEFLEKLLNNELSDISKTAHENTRVIMDREETWSKWKLYGKTGGGTTGWFIGWIEKEGVQPIVFAQYLDKKDPNLDLSDLPVQKTVGLTAKELAKRHLKSFWEEETSK